MKIKDLLPNKGLGGVRFRYPGDGKLYYWHSQWQKGVWGKTDMASDQVYPLDCDDLKEALEWEVVECKKARSVGRGNAEHLADQVPQNATNAAVFQQREREQG